MTQTQPCPQELTARWEGWEGPWAKRRPGVDGTSWLGGMYPAHCTWQPQPGQRCWGCPEQEGEGGTRLGMEWEMLWEGFSERKESFSWAVVAKQGLSRQRRDGRKREKT